MSKEKVAKQPLIGIIMGRHAGFLAAAASLARKYPEDGPHLVYLPERSFSKKSHDASTHAIATSRENSSTPRAVKNLSMRRQHCRYQTNVESL